MASSYIATVRWQRAGAVFTDNQYSRAHHWCFDGGLEIPASASPHIVPLPLSVAENVDPEEAFVASLSSCHMLFFLSLAAKQGWCIEDYTDEAVGVLARGDNGKQMMTQVTLNPVVSLTGTLPEENAFTELHHQAHQLCFIARSVRTEVLCHPRLVAYQG